LVRVNVTTIPSATYSSQSLKSSSRSRACWILS